MDSYGPKTLESKLMRTERLPWYEFFAGGGMARIGLGDRWECMFANEWCEKKAAAYRAFFGNGAHLLVDDVANLTVSDLPGTPALVWASFPCQDLSLAGNGAGLNGHRSGTFAPFWDLMRQMNQLGRKPKLVVLENVVGTLSSHGGKDFSSLIECLVGEGYRAGAFVVNAVHFVPQSRPRLFIVAVDESADINPVTLVRTDPDPLWHGRSVVAAYKRLNAKLQNHWVWWSLPRPNVKPNLLSSLIEENPNDVEWHTEKETRKLVSLMSPLHQERLRKVQAYGKRAIGTIYKRMRPGKDGKRVQRAEVRFDDVSGCLRTPAGGSSRQIILLVEGEKLRSRLLSPIEAARLMGVPQHYPIPAKYNEAYHLFGDGLVVPVVSFIESNLLYPLTVSKAATIAA